MTRKELIELARSKGVDRIWNRSLTSCMKSEIEEWLNHLHAEGDTFGRHLSYSQLTDYLLCGRKYFYKRVDPNAPRFPLPAHVHAGSAYHRGVAEGLEEKKSSGAAPNLTAMTDAYVELYQNPGREIDWADYDKGIGERQGVELVRLYRHVVIPSLYPYEVEEQSIVEFKNRGWRLMVIPDLEAVDDSDQVPEELVVDHKRASKTPDLNEAEESEQLTTYAMARQVKTGKLPKVRLDKAVSLKGYPRKETVGRYAALEKTADGVVGIVKLLSERTPRQIERYLKTLEMAAQMIAHGVFMPARSGTWPCTINGCELWNYCHEVF